MECQPAKVDQGYRWRSVELVSRRIEGTKCSSDDGRVEGDRSPMDGLGQDVERSVNADRIQQRAPIENGSTGGRKVSGTPWRRPQVDWSA